MEPQSCVLCESSATVHVDERHNRHVGCPKCGSYIAAEDFGGYYVKLDPDHKSVFTDWMARKKGDEKRYLYKKQPLKNNAYGKRDGFRMISISQIKSKDFGPDATEGRKRTNAGRIEDE